MLSGYLSPYSIVKVFRFMNEPCPEFYQAQAMRLSTFGKPRIISCCEDFPKHLGLPRGCLDELLGLFRSLKVNETEAKRLLADESLYATDLADMLVTKGVPFKQAHDQAGQIVGFVGESGTPESITNPGSEYHLHFEVRVGDSYLGKGLAPAEVRRLYQTLFSP